MTAESIIIYLQLGHWRLVAKASRASLNGIVSMHDITTLSGYKLSIVTIQSLKVDEGIALFSGTVGVAGILQYRRKGSFNSHEESNAGPRYPLKGEEYAGTTEFGGEQPCTSLQQSILRSLAASA